jgi:hypothetical protein
MVFDFAAQPPELISAKIYSGPGAESLTAAAAAWDALAGELQSTAAQFQSTIAGLVGGDWTGPSAEAAAAAAAPYVSWLGTTAGQAEQTAGQATAAASAYETALAATVPPAEIVANRTQLLQLVPANIFGQYNAAIAALEAEYAQFWAQDVAAITGYAGSSQAATTGLGSFTEAPQTTTDNGTAAQAASTAQAAATAPVDPLTQIITQIETDVNSFSKALTTFNSTYQRTRPPSGRLEPVFGVPRRVEFREQRRQSGDLHQRRQQHDQPRHLPVEELLHLPAVEPRHRAGIAGRRAVLAGASRRPGNRGQGGVSGAGQRAHGGQVVGATQLGRRHPGDQACGHVVAGWGLCRDGRSNDGGSAERAQPGQPLQPGRWGAG